MNFNEVVQSHFNVLLEGAKGSEKNFRQQAWNEYQRMGLPGSSDEAWKYSNLKSVTGKGWSLSKKTSLPQEALALREKHRAQFDVVVLINGQLALEESLFQGSELKISPLVLEAGLDIYQDGLSGLTAALTQGGFKIEVPINVKPKRPLLIIHSQSAAEAMAVSKARIQLGSNSELHLAEIFCGASLGLRSHTTEVELGAGANLHWVRILRDSEDAHHLSDCTVKVGRDAQINYGNINGGSTWARSLWTAEVLGEGAGVNVYGLNFGRNVQHADQRIVVNHRVANTNSSQLFKGILKDRARGVLNGRIFIAQDAQKVNSSQLNHNLILSPGAEADTKPELEIFADDVKANHGASIGRMDETKLFYLMSRGIRRSEAQQMLAKAFVHDVLMKIGPKSLRGLLEETVEELLPDFSTEMEVIK